MSTRARKESNIVAWEDKMGRIYKTIRIHPSGLQFLVTDGMTMLLTLFVLALAGYDGLMPRSWSCYALGVGIFLILYLFYRYVYITRMVFVLTEEQLKYEHGVFTTEQGYIELYRIVDYSEHRSFFQLLLGLKTITLYSGDRTTPSIDLIGIWNDMDLVDCIRERVEYNKRRRNIHEFTNTK